MNSIKNIGDIRRDYKLQSLDENDTDQEAVAQFLKWWQQAINSNIDEVNAMTLSTVDETNRPSSRIVLLKGFTDDGFIFFTNYQGRKARDMKQNDAVSLVFFWKELERQVRIEGRAKKIAAEDNDVYFASRPEGSKIGAWASPQSQVIDSREILEQAEHSYKQKFAGIAIPRPPHWGGYIIKPDMIEFWQGRPGRLHDRIRYQLTENHSWKKERLAP